VSGLTCPEGHTDSLYSVERAIVRYPIRPTAKVAGWEYTGDHYDTFDETATHEGIFYCGECGEDFTERAPLRSAPCKGPGPQEYEGAQFGRQWTPCPACGTMHDGGES
jgi:ribosomal protein S27AE